MPGLVSVEGGTAWGYSVTPGILYKVNDRLTIGFKVDEIVNYQKWGTETEEIAPSKYRLGLSYKLLVVGCPLLVAADVSQLNKEGYVAEAGAGMEYEIGQIAFRLGYVDAGLTAGVGFGAEHIRIDYAYVTQTSLSKDNVHRVSLTGMW